MNYYYIIRIPSWCDRILYKKGLYMIIISYYINVVDILWIIILLSIIIISY